MDLRVLLGERVAQRRKDLDLTQGDLGKRLSWPQPRVSEVERGKAWPDPERLQALAQALECEPADLLGSEPPKKRRRRIKRLDTDTP